MNKLLALFSAVGLIASLEASLTVESVSLTQDPLTHVVTVSYVLSGGPAIVTLDFQRKSGDEWVSIGDENQTSVYGEANRLVRESESAHVAYWQPDESWRRQHLPSGGLQVKVTAWPTNAPPDYMVVDLRIPNTVYYYTSEKALPYGGVSADLYKQDMLVMRKIPSQGMTWCMGSPEGEIGRADDETQHYVTFTDKDYYMSIYTVTYAQYYRICGSYPYVYNTAPGENYMNMPASLWPNVRGGREDYPWPEKGHEVLPGGMVGLLRSRSGIDFDLPTEAQWEYACRAGTGTALNNGKDLYHATDGEGLADIAWYDTLGGYLHEVGLKNPNAWGLYDMHGNVFESCLDWYAGESADPVTNPVGPKTGTVTVLRGGCTRYAAASLRSAARVGSENLNYCNGSCGIRLVCPSYGTWDPVVVP